MTRELQSHRLRRQGLRLRVCRTIVSVVAALVVRAVIKDVAAEKAAPGYQALEGLIEGLAEGSQVCPGGSVFAGAYRGHLQRVDRHSAR